MVGRATALMSPDETTVLFWRRQARVGIIVSAVVLTQIAAYSTLVAPAHRMTVLLGLVGAGSAMTALAALVAPKAMRRNRQREFFYVWSLVAAAVILAATAADGGSESPLAATLFLPLLFAALAYQPTAVVALGTVEIVGYVAVGVTASGRHAAYIGVVASTLVIATFMATQSAHNRAVQQNQLQTLAARLSHQATHDELTGCLNRRGFDVALDLELARSARYRRALAVLLVDVDRLKEINDRGGHRSGDRALQTAATALHAAARGSDVVARIGGDEFVVLAPETDAHEAVRLAVRARAELARLQPAGDVTVSIGIVSARRRVEPNELMQAADAALYDAKHAGRDCIRVGPDSVLPVPAPRQPTGS